jgi:hypothetical protein
MIFAGYCSALQYNNREQRTQKKLFFENTILGIEPLPLEDGRFS